MTVESTVPIPKGIQEAFEVLVAFYSEARPDATYELDLQQQDKLGKWYDLRIRARPYLSGDTREANENPQ